MRRRHLTIADFHAETLRLRRQYRRNRTRPPVPSDRDFRDGDSYLIEAHAALEHYFEELCRRALHASARRYASDAHCNPVLGSLLQAHYWKSAARAGSEEFRFRDERESVAAAIKWHAGQIRANNGIGRRNMLALLLPLGFGETDFDEVWLANMSSFGSDRGAVAHGQPLAPPVVPSVRLPGRPTLEISIYTTNYGPRTQISIWEVEDRLAQLLPDAYRWDERVLERCR